MVDITEKSVTTRTVKASGSIFFSEATAEAIEANRIEKGDIYTYARAAAMLAAKKTPDLLPHCHPLTIEKLSCDFNLTREHATPSTIPSNKNPPCHIEVTVAAKTSAKTGLEMEALTAVSVALLTIYDMLKPIDKELVIDKIRLLEKTGGKSDFSHKF